MGYRNGGVRSFVVPHTVASNLTIPAEHAPLIRSMHLKREDDRLTAEGVAGNRSSTTRASLANEDFHPVGGGSRNLGEREGNPQGPTGRRHRLRV
jgi:hypothetical protein